MLSSKIRPKRKPNAVGDVTATKQVTVLKHQAPKTGSLDRPRLSIHPMPDHLAVSPSPLCDNALSRSAPTTGRPVDLQLQVPTGVEEQQHQQKDKKHIAFFVLKDKPKLDDSAPVSSVQTSQTDGKKQIS